MIRKARPFSREEFTRRRPANLQGVSINVVTVRGRELDIGRVERWVQAFSLDSEWMAAREMVDA